jgi:hypothetical protein
MNKLTSDLCPLRLAHSALPFAIGTSLYALCSTPEVIGLLRVVRVFGGEYRLEPV